MLNGWQGQPIDNGFECFHRNSGTNLLIKNKSTLGLKRTVPRSLQVSLTGACNFSCAYCYSPQKPFHSINTGFLIDFLQQADRHGIFEVSFGGGEPLLYKNFIDMIKTLKETTALGLNMTTNGSRLTEKIAEQLKGRISEFRLSIHNQTDYKTPLRILQGENIGANIVLSDTNIQIIEPFIYELLSLGVNNILLLGYKGPEPRFHLSEKSLAQLRNFIQNNSRLPLRLDACLYPLIPDIPYLFKRRDCGAGSEYLSIGADQTVKQCSFTQEKLSFDSFEEFLSIYDKLSAGQKKVDIAGCYRDLFKNDSSGEKESRIIPSAESTVYIWNAYSSNNSGDYTIIGTFESSEKAAEISKALNELLEKHLEYRSEGEGVIEALEPDFRGDIPTPPLIEFGKEHGFDWSQEGEGFWWNDDTEGDSGGMTIGHLQNSVVVYHPETLDSAVSAFVRYFKKENARVQTSEDGSDIFLKFTAKGDNGAVLKEIGEYFELANETEEHPAELDEPPWGEEAESERLGDLHDENTMLSYGPHRLTKTDNGAEFIVCFMNTYAGAIAFEEYLTENGFTNIEISVVQPTE